MTRRLLVAFAALLALGAALDATVLRAHVGSAITSAAVRGGDEATSEPRVRSVPTPVGQARRQYEQRYGVYIALHDLAPGATVFRDASVPAERLPRTLLVGMGSASSVRAVDITDLVVPEGPPDASGRYRFGDWTLRLGPGPVSQLVAVQDADGTHLIDVRLLPTPIVPALPDETSTANPSLRVAPFRWAVVGEASALVVMLLAGGLLLPRGGRGSGGLRGIRLPLALVVGVALHASVGLLLLPGLWGLAGTVAIAILVTVVVDTPSAPTGWRRSDVRPLVVAVGLILVVVAISRWSGYLLLIPDSYEYWAGGAALAQGAFGIQDLDVKRGLSLQALHATGFAVGAAGLQAIGVVLLVAGGSMLLGLARQTGSLRRVTVLTAGFLVVALALSPQTRAMAAFLNSHVLVAVILLTLVVLLGEGTDRTARRTLLPAVAALITALVMTRAEGAPLVALVLLGSLAARTERPVWRSAWFVLGGAATLWAALLAVGGPTLADLLIAATGVAAVTVGLLLATVAPSVRRASPWVVGAAAWSSAALLLRRDRVQFLDAAVANLGGGQGGWGLLGPLLLLAGIVAVLHTSRGQDLRTLSARWLLIGFIPLTVVAKLGDGAQAADRGIDVFLTGGGRTGWGDSANRMWMHAVLVIFLLLIAAVRDDEGVRQDSSARWIGRAGGDLALVAAGVWIVLQWQPDYVPRTTVPESAEVLRVDGVDAVGELVDGSEVRQTVALPPLAQTGLSATARPTSVCVALPLVTYGRTVDGSLRIELSVAGRSTFEHVRGADIVDWGTVRTCLDLRSTRRRDEPLDVALASGTTLEIVVTGVDAVAGAAPSVLVGPGPEFGALVALPSDAGVAVPRRRENLAVEVVLEAERPLRPTELPLKRSALVLPWIALVVGGASVASRWHGGRSEPVRASSRAGRGAMAAPGEDDDARGDT